MSSSSNRRRRLVFVAVLALVLTAGLPAAAEDQQSFPEVFNIPDGWQPEGIAVGRGSSFYVGSLLTGAVYGGDLRTGGGAVVVPPQLDGRIAVGLDVDARSNAIFVAGGGPAIGLPIPGSGYVYDADTGEELAAYDFQGLFVNDVIVTRDAAYFTDSLQPVLFKVPLGPGGSLADTFETILLSGDFVQGGFPSANGIVATPDGKALIVANTISASLHKVDPDTGVATEIDLGGESVPSADGLVLAGKRLYVVQNALNQVGVIDLDPSLTSGVVGEPLISSDYMIPTTADIFGNTLYAVNARFGDFTPGVPSPDLEFTVVGLPAR